MSICLPYKYHWREKRALTEGLDGNFVLLCMPIFTIYVAMFLFMHRMFTRKKCKWVNHVK